MEHKRYQEIKLSCKNMVDNALVKSVILIGKIDYACLDTLKSEFDCLEFKQVEYGLIINRLDKEI